MLMFVPVLAFFIIFDYVPMFGVLMAFEDYTFIGGIFGSKWTGFDNFRRLFQGDFLHVIQNTVVISVLRIVLGFPAPVILALLLNEVRVSWYKRAVQTITYLPYFFSWVMLGGIMIMIFAYNGPANTLLTGFGLKPADFLTNGTWFIVILLLSGIWQSIGYNAIIYLAAITGIDQQLYEAAIVDGAGKWKQIVHITLPGLRPTIIIMFILGLGGILNAGFDQIYNMFNPMVYNVSNIIDIYVLNKTKALDFSIGTAAGLFKSAVGLVLIVLSNWLVNKYSEGEYGIW